MDEDAEFRALMALALEAIRTHDESKAEAAAVGLARFVMTQAEKQFKEHREPIPASAASASRVRVPTSKRKFRRMESSPAERAAVELQRCAILETARSIYLDWNVFLDLQGGALPRLGELFDRRQAAGACIPFAAEHVTEAALSGHASRSHASVAEADLQFLSLRTRDQYFYHGIDAKGRPIVRTESPQSVLKTLTADAVAAALADEAQERLLKLVSGSAIAAVRERGGFDPQDLSTIATEDVASYIDCRLAESVSPGHAPQTFRGLVEGTKRFFPSHWKFDISDHLIGAFRLFDLFGYRPEKKGHARAAAIDGGHAGMASFTECLVTRDRRFLNKARAAFAVFGVTTHVIDGQAAERFAAGDDLRPTIRRLE